MGVRTDASETAAPASSRSPTSIRRRRSKRSSASTAASSAPRPTPRRVMTWAWERGEKLLMLPDQHLGRNTAFKMGVPLDEMVVWDPNEMCGGLDADAGRGGEADPVEGALLGPHALHRAADRGVPEEVSRRPGRSRTPSARSTSCRRPTRAARPSTSSTRCKTSPAGIVWAVGDRGPPGQPARRRGRAGQDRRHARSVRLPVLDDVPRLAEPPALDARRAGRRQGPQPDHRPRADASGRQAGARSDAGVQ